jgi:hypothetical protein
VVVEDERLVAGHHRAHADAVARVVDVLRDPFEARLLAGLLGPLRDLARQLAHAVGDGGLGTGPLSVGGGDVGVAVEGPVGVA